MDTWEPTPTQLRALMSPPTRSQLTIEQVLDARLRVRAGVPPGQLAQEYGVRSYVVKHAVEGRTWRALPFPPDDMKSINIVL